MKTLVSLNSFVPRFFYTTSVSLVMIKSYVLDKLERRGEDLPLEIRIDNFSCEGDREEMVERICSRGPSIVGFSVYPWNMLLIRELVPRVKERLPDTLVALGGPAVSFDTRNAFGEWTGADAAVRGPGEETFYRLVKAWRQGRDLAGVPNLVYRRGEEVVETDGERNFSVEEQHYPLRTQELEGLFQVNYDTSRGCAFRCGYCAWNVDGLEPPGIKYYPMSKVKEDLSNIFLSDSLARLSLNDSNITVNEARCLEIFRHINGLNAERRRRKQPSVEIVLDLNPQYFTDPIIQEMKRLRIGALGFGLQSVDEEVLRIANRKFDRERYVRNLRKLSEKTGVRIIMEIIFGLPGDTLDKFRKSVEFVLSELRTYSFICFRYLVLPGSPFWYQREKYGIVHGERPPYEVISTSTFSREEMDYADRMACWLEMFFSVLRSVKKTVESRAFHEKRPQTPVYEALVEGLSKRYEDFFEKGFKQEYTYYYMDKLREKRHAGVRRAILSDARRILKDLFDSN